MAVGEEGFGEEDGERERERHSNHHHLPEEEEEEEEVFLLFFIFFFSFINPKFNFPLKNSLKITQYLHKKE